MTKLNELIAQYYYLTKWVYNSPVAKLTMRNDNDISIALNNILNDEIFRRNFATSRDKWLDIDDDEVIDWLICFLPDNL